MPIARGFPSGAISIRQETEGGQLRLADMVLWGDVHSHQMFSLSGDKEHGFALCLSTEALPFCTM